MGIPLDFEKLVNIVEETWDKPGLITDVMPYGITFAGMHFLVGT